MKKFLVACILFLYVGIASAGEEKKVTFAATVTDGVQRVEILGGDYYFEPNHIIVKKDIPVEFVVKKAPGMVPHNIVMNEPDAGMVFKIDFGKEGEVVTFTPTKAGTYAFYCDKRFLFFKSHEERGMHGEIEVTD